MNFVISRAEVIAISGIKRTRTFELQQQGLLRVLSKQAKQIWFCLMDVLKCVAHLHGLPPPDAAELQTCIQAVVDARLKLKFLPQKIKFPQ